MCRRVGADLAINYKTDDFVAPVKEFTGGRGADVVIDPVGGDVFDRSTKCIAFEGRIIVIGFTSGRIPEAKANHVLVKNYAVVGLHWGLYSQVAPRLIPPVTEELMKLYAKGAIKPFVSMTKPFVDAKEALALVATGGSSGKVVLTLT